MSKLRLFSAISIATLALGFGLQLAAAQDSIDVGVLLPDSKSSARWEADDRRFLQAAFDAAGVKASIVNAEADAQTQTTQAEQAITNGAKVLLLVDLDSGSGAAIIAKAHDAGVKVIDYDRLTLSDASAGIAADFYVSFDNVSVGKLQGQGLVDAVKAAQAAGTMDKEVNVAFLNGSPTDNNATLFAQGAHSVIDPVVADATSGWKIVAEQAVPGWDNQQALVIFEQMQTDHPEINAALAANDGLGQAVISARENAKLGYIPVTGQDATAGGIQNVLAGKQSMTVYKAVKQEADAASALAIALVKGTDTAALTNGATTNNGAKDVPSVLLVPVAVTKDNVAETVIADGFRTWAEICVGDFVQYCPADWDATPEATMATAEATP